MSREKEIIKICERLKELWLALPELQFGQIVENFIHKNSNMKDTFYQIDGYTKQYIIEAIEKYGNPRRGSFFYTENQL